MKKLLAFVLGLFVASTALATNTTMYPPVGGPFATQPVVVAASGNVYNPTTASSQSVPSSDVLPLMANGWTTINPNPVTSNLNFGALSMNGVPSAANSWLYSTSTITGTPTNPATGIARNSPMYFSYKDTVVYPYAGGGLFEQLYINDALTAGWDGFRGNELIYAVNAPPITGPNFYIFGSWTGTGTNGTYDVTFGIIGTNCTGTAPTGQIVVAGGVVTSVTDITAGTGCAIGDVLSFTVTGGSGTATLSNVPPSPGTTNVNVLLTKVAVGSSMGGIVGQHALAGGSIFGFNPNIYSNAGADATGLQLMTSAEFDNQVGAGSQVYEKHILNMALRANDLVQGTIDDSGLVFGTGNYNSATNNLSGGSAWHFGLAFTEPEHDGPWNYSSILMGGTQRWFAANYQPQIAEGLDLTQFQIYPGIVVTGASGTGGSNGVATLTFSQTAVTMVTSGATGNGTTATVTFNPMTVGVPATVGTNVTIAGFACGGCTGYNGTYTVTASTFNSVSYANTTTTTATGVAGTVGTVSYSMNFPNGNVIPVGSTIIVQNVKPSTYDTGPGGAIVIASTTGSVQYASTANGTYTSGGNIQMPATEGAFLRAKNFIVNNEGDVYANNVTLNNGQLNANSGTVQSITCVPFGGYQCGAYFGIAAFPTIGIDPPPSYSSTGGVPATASIQSMSLAAAIMPVPSGVGCATSGTFTLTGGSSGSQATLNFTANAAGIVQTLSVATGGTYTSGQLTASPGLSGGSCTTYPTVLFGFGVTSISVNNAGLNYNCAAPPFVYSGNANADANTPAMYVANMACATQPITPNAGSAIYAPSWSTGGILMGAGVPQNLQDTTSQTAVTALSATATGTGTTATVTFAAQASAPVIGSSLTVAGMSIAGYNGSYTVLASPAPTTTTASYANTTTGSGTGGNISYGATLATEAGWALPVMTFDSTVGSTITNLAELYIPAPVASANVTATNLWSIYAIGGIKASALTASGGTVALNVNSSTSITNIGTGTTSGTVSIGTANTVAILSGASTGNFTLDSGTGTGTITIGNSGNTGKTILANLATDATHTDATVCEDTTTHTLYFGSGTGGLCLGTSSRRYKHHIAPMTVGLDIIEALKPISYKLNADHGDPNKELYGFTAEDMQGIVPKLVGLDAQGRPNTVDYVGLIPVLVKAVQEQHAIVRANKWQLDGLQRRVDREEWMIAILVVWCSALTAALFVIRRRGD